MESLEFLTAVLPSQGKYCTFTMRDKMRKNIFVDDLQNLYDTNLKLSGLGQNTFYALSAFDDSGTREAVHAQTVRSLFMDLDCGVDPKTGKQKAFPNKKAAITALQAFLEASGLATLGMPWLVDSGGGVHVYWPLYFDADMGEWQQAAEALKRAAKRFAFPIDMTCTADASRVLRMPGTLNWKYAPPKPVLLRHRGDTFNLRDIAGALAGFLPPPPKPPGTSLALPGKPPSTALTPTAKAMMGNSDTLFKSILVKTFAGTGCGQLQYYIDHAAEDGMEPIWRGLLSWAKVCDDGDKAARKISAMHPYDEERMLQKLSEIKGPYACHKMDSENPGICGSCRHWGKFTNPLVLGREVQTITAAVTVSVPQEEDAPHVTLDRPEPPRDFEYGRNGGVYYRKKSDKEDEEDKLFLLTPYDFFMTRMFRDGFNYQAEFKVIKGSKIFTFAVPTKDITKMDSCIKVLASNNVIAAHAGCDMYLYHYVRQSINTASSTGSEVPVPPRFGWQDDGNFAVHDTVYSTRGPEYDYQFVSDRLGNLISATQPSGTLEGYAEMVHMMRRKAAHDPMVWGHLAIIGAGLGSILMHFTPHGSRAATMHICSTTSGSGKTISQAMGVSAWGDPNRYTVAATTSEKTMMQRASLLGSIVLPIDEVTEKIREHDRGWLPRFVFDYAAGMHKIKGTAAGNTEVQHDALWTGLALLTSNAPGLEAMMGARSHTSEGEARRYLEWQIPRGYTLKWTEEERRIRDTLAENYGVAGPTFARWCVTHQEKVRDIVARVTAHWNEISGATDDERFWTAASVSIISAFLLAGPKYANIINVPTISIIDFLLALVKRHRRVIAGNQRTALDILNAYTAEHLGSFVKTEGSHVMQHLLGGQALQPGSSRFAVKGRIEYNVTPGHVDYYIEVRTLKLHCADNSTSYEAFLKELQSLERTTVQVCRKNLLSGTKGSDMKVQCVRITRTIADAESDDK